ncbi:MAG: S-methyl-5'-thioinosine phosphorylase [Lautropia sp.]|nr:S-methyl-5'-thioinosine phosphorylase [Lautropia sp.]
MLGIIGGSGLAKLVGLQNVRREITRTRWGQPSSALSFGDLDGVSVVFMARHGYGHTIAPQDINYRANIAALKQAGVAGIISVATVGGIRSDLVPGKLAVPDQLIDYSTGRVGTYYSGPDQPVVHVDFTQPYDAAMRSRLLAAAHHLETPVFDTGCYACMSGPRLETAAEIRRLERDGCDMVGMTGMPEAVLAREAELPYAALAVVANYAAGKGDASSAVPMDAIGLVLEEAMKRVLPILGRAVRQP